MSERSATITTEKAVDLRAMVLPYVVVAKPWVVALVLVAALSGMYMANHGLPSPYLMIWSLLGIGMATAGAAVLNNYIDQDIDRIMKRTSRRPLPAGLVERGKVLTFGLSLSILSITITALFVNNSAAALTAAAIFIYVVAYTILSKRRTPLATFIGGVGGALPPVIGYAAIKPDLDVNALVLFLIIFAWQHPHFWALALKYVGEYRMADVRNLPVVSGVEATKRRIALWAVILAVVSLSPYFLGMAGVYYLATAVLIGAVHVVMSIAFLLSSRKVAMSLFFYSIVQLPALFCVMLVNIS